MSEIRVLPKEIAERIAAGEVVERPASVIKELVENSIDAGATSITVEIERGGITYMRVTDNGSGIAKDQIKTAFLRHATSKIQRDTDLDSITTLGFRGEALASIAAVSRVEVLSAVRGQNGVSYVIEGGEEVSLEEGGCPVGTTIIVRDLFYNVPARMKFLKKDVSEGNTVAAMLDRMALSHPEIAFRLIRDGKSVLNTGGDGSLKSAVYSVLGRDYSSGMIPVSYSEAPFSIEGFTCLPARCRANRNGQFFFLNGRYIKSGTLAAALDQAYKNSSMVGRFPACVLTITIPPETVDVNVHPAKTEVRFSEEKRVFDIAYRAVRQAISMGDRRLNLQIGSKNPLNPFVKQESFTQTKSFLSKEEEITQAVTMKKPPAASTKKISVSVEPFGHTPIVENTLLRDDTTTFVQPIRSSVLPETKPAKNSTLDILVEEEPQAFVSKAVESAKSNLSTALPSDETKLPEKTAVAYEKTSAINPDKILYVGEAFATYILVSYEEALYWVDKHAAHERIRFEELKQSFEIQSQLLLTPLSVTLVREEYDTVITHLEILERCGFLLEDFGGSTVLVRSVPALLCQEDAAQLLSEMAGNLMEKKGPMQDRVEDILHQIACKSAIKSGDISSKEELYRLAVRVLTDDSLMYCPHGRPIAFQLSKAQIEKQFGRLGPIR